VHLAFLAERIGQMLPIEHPPAVHKHGKMSSQRP
jgi:hypothetical protein